MFRKFFKILFSYYKNRQTIICNVLCSFGYGNTFLQALVNKNRDDLIILISLG